MTKIVLTSDRLEPYNPPEMQLALQAEEPVAEVDWPGRGDFWVIAKHEDVRAALVDPRLSSDRSDPQHPAHMAYNPATHAGQLVELDPPKHSELRGRIMKEFTVKRIAAMRPRVEEVVSEAIDAMLAGGHEGDLVTLLALPVPSLVIADLLDVPDEDHAFFQGHSSKFAGEGTPEERVAAVAAIRDYIADLIDQRIENPGNDILSRQLAAGATRDEAIGLGFLLLIAGHETTANQITLSIMTLLDKPELFTQLQEDPSLIPGAVEELLRYFSIAEVAHARLATSDIEIRGVTVPEGAKVWALANVANRDPEVFPDPHKIDFRRGARNHLAFGFGPHQCLGQNVARLELEVVLEQVVNRLPTLRLTVPVSDLSFKQVGNFGVHELPVAW